ncbi:acyl-CoA dehydrogenase family protein [Citricoccus sp. GCM10030269]|uniref:acyl-CoA dehydrogenase family protein n=1 Tax=Citricoccus sp. GCM10030269 TaxID=3273388 RepID=UPI00361CE3BA
MSATSLSEETISGDRSEVDLVGLVHSLEPQIREAEGRIETEGRTPIELIHQLYDGGLFRSFLPRELGGLEVHPADWLKAIIELSRINGSVGWLGMLHAGGTWCEPEVMKPILAQNRWITAGNLGRAAGKAYRVDGGYRITGKWPFSSGSPEATYLYGRSMLYDENDNQVFHPVDGNPWYITGYFPREDVIVHDDWDALGLRGTGSGHIEVKDVFVPTEMVNELGVHYRAYDRPLYRAPFNVLAHSAHAIGLLQSALEEFVAQVHKAASHGSLRQARLGNEQIHQHAAGKTDAVIRSLTAYLMEVAHDAYENAKDHGPVEYVHRVRIHQVNVHCVQRANEALHYIYQQTGSPGIFRGTRIERIFRDMTVAAQHTLVGDASMDRVGQYLLTKDLPSGPQIDVSSTGFIMGPHPQFDTK